MRPTTKDLAREAGVSLATVDRVLNGRSGVRKKTIESVNAAIERIGFERNQVAATLARKRAYKFAFVLPKDGDEFLGGIVDHIQEVNDSFRAEMIEVKALHVDERDPHKTVKYLSEINVDDFDGIAIMAPELPQIRDALRRLRERGVQTIPFIANQQDEDSNDFVGIDNQAAGATAGRLMGRFLGGTPGSIAVVTDSMQSRDSIERRLGFDAVINKDFGTATVLPSLETHSDPERIKTIIKNVFKSQKDLVGLYIMGSEAREILEAVEKYGQDRTHLQIAHERTPSTTKALRSGTLDAVVTQDPGHLVRSAVRKLRAKCENRETMASQEKIRIEILMADNL